MIAMVVLNRFNPFRKDQAQVAAVSGSDARADFIGDGDLSYAVEHGGNGSDLSYQEASGAPVETDSPFG